MKTKVFAIALLFLGIAFALQAGQAMAADPIDIPAFTPGARILFQGDSITDMARGRTADPNHILGHSYAFLIAARYGADFPERKLIFINRGVSGNKTADLPRRWQTDTIDLHPDILSILIGINDLNAAVTADDFQQRYEAILEQTERDLPHVKLVLCEPFALPTGPKKEVWDRYRPWLEKWQAIVAALADKHHAVLVKLQKVFDDACRRAPADYWIWDGIHPTYCGQQLIADEWVRTVRDFWK
jgi:lysophospholipase L1-like esterase